MKTPLFLTLVFALECFSAAGATIVDNSSEPVTSSVISGPAGRFEIAQEFTTANDGLNYTLDSVTINGLTNDLSFMGPANVLISLYDIDASGAPHDSLDSVNVSLPGGVSSVTAVLPGSFQLLADTSYAIGVRLVVGGSAEIVWDLTASSASTGIGSLGTLFFWNTGGNPLWQPQSGAGLLTINGSPVVVPEPTMSGLIGWILPFVLLTSFRAHRCRLSV